MAEFNNSLKSNCKDGKVDISAIALDCEVCYERFYTEAYEKKDIVENSINNFYIKTFCCQHPLCSICIQNIIQSTSSCPWCKRKWIGRSIFKKCLEITPLVTDKFGFNNATADSGVDSLAGVQSCSNSNPYINGTLGDGLLRNEYMSKLHELQRESQTQTKSDEELALKILSENEKEIERDRLKLQRIAEEDAKLALELSEGGNSYKSSGYSGSSNGTIDAFVERKKHGGAPEVINTISIIGRGHSTSSGRSCSSTVKTGNCNSTSSQVHKTQSLKSIPKVVQMLVPQSKSERDESAMLRSSKIKEPRSTMRNAHTIQEMRDVSEKDSVCSPCAVSPDYQNNSRTNLNINRKPMVCTIELDSESESEVEALQYVACKKSKCQHVPVPTSAGQCSSNARCGAVPCVEPDCHALLSECDDHQSKFWSCVSCTFRNNCYLNICEMCSSKRINIENN